MPTCQNAPAPLIDRVMDRAEQRIGNVALVKLQGSRINFHKFCLLPKGGFLPRLRLLQNQPRRRRFAHAGRSVNEDMLRIGTAERRTQGANRLLLPDDLCQRLVAGLLG